MMSWEVVLDPADALPKSKGEPEPAPPLCRGCLTRGRRMVRLGRLSDVYDMLMATSTTLEPMEQLARIEVCWECHAMLGRISRFRTQVLSVNILLHSTDIMADSGNLSLSGLRVHSKPEADYTIYHDLEVHFPSDIPEGIIYGLDAYSDPMLEEVAPPPLYSEEDHSDYEKPAVRKSKRPVKKRKMDDDDFDLKKKARGRKQANPKKVLRPAPKSKDKSQIKSDRVVTVRMTDAELAQSRAEIASSDQFQKAYFKCDSCVLGFPSELSYEKHMRTKHSSDLGPFECDICRCRFPSEAQLSSHRRAHYEVHACQCGYTHRSFRQAMQHYRDEHRSNNQHTCKECNSTFPTQRMLRYHKECEHKAAQVCPHCDKSFNNSGTYKQHLLMHTGMPLYECSVCLKQYRGKHGLRAHMRTHPTGNPPADAFCADCNVQFKHKYLYRHHLKTSAKHVPPEKLRFPCARCDKRFFVASALKIHMDTAHLNKKSFKCDQCQKAYATKSRLSCHIKFSHDNHRLSKSHVCETCGRAFSTKQQMIRHLPTHTGERPYACETCGATFRQTSALYTHRRLVHLKIKGLIT